MAFRLKNNIFCSSNVFIKILGPMVRQEGLKVQDQNMQYANAHNNDVLLISPEGSTFAYQVRHGSAYSLHRLLY